MQDRERHQQDRRRPEHPVDLDLQRRGRMAELLRLAGELLRVGVLADRVDLVVAGARDAEGAGEQPVAARPCGSRRPRRSAATRRSSARARRRPRRRRRADRRARPGRRRRGRPRREAARAARRRGTTGGARRDEQGEVVERLLGLDLLADPDRRVDDRDQSEQRVGVQALAEHEDEEDEDDPVEERQDVRPDDRGDRAARGAPRRDRARASLRAASPELSPRGWVVVVAASIHTE